jgi:hypothetical protein
LTNFARGSEINSIFVAIPFDQAVGNRGPLAFQKQRFSAFLCGAPKTRGQSEIGDLTPWR